MSHPAQALSSNTAARAANRRAAPSEETRSARDNWIHDFRNALGNTTIAASAVRAEIDQRSYQQIDMLMRQIEEGCDRCLRLLSAMPA
jgi:hypothetical protein